MSDAVSHYLKTRRSHPSVQLGEPGPGEEEMRALLTIAARVPDHGKLAPWRFIVYPQDARKDAAAWLAAFAEANAEEGDRRKRAEGARQFAVAPLVVAIVSAPVAHPKIPEWEQLLSAGAVCLNLVHAANAHGFAAQWLTGWYAYDDEAARYLGLREGERVAGFIHIGAPTVALPDRERPDIEAITTIWAPGETR